MKLLYIILNVDNVTVMRNRALFKIYFFLFKLFLDRHFFLLRYNIFHICKRSNKIKDIKVRNVDETTAKKYNLNLKITC